VRKGGAGECAAAQRPATTAETSSTGNYEEHNDKHGMSRMSETNQLHLELWKGNSVLIALCSWSQRNVVINSKKAQSEAQHDKNLQANLLVC
jgi:hypothetical protein